MLKRLAAVLLLVGLCLPYGCDARPITAVWADPETILMVGIPVLVTVAYALHVLLPALARFHERNGAAFHGIFRAAYLMLAGAYLYFAVHKEGEHADKFHALVALVVTAGLLWWQQRRGTKAQRLPLLLLVIVGLPEVLYFLSAMHAHDVDVGAYVFTAGYLLAVGLEVRDLRGAPRI
jgi:ABC-type amino acid transport system permease subunit